MPLGTLLRRVDYDFVRLLPKSPRFPQLRLFGDAQAQAHPERSYRFVAASGTSAAVAAARKLLAGIPLLGARGRFTAAAPHGIGATFGCLADRLVRAPSAGSAARAGPMRKPATESTSERAPINGSIPVLQLLSRRREGGLAQKHRSRSRRRRLQPQARAAKPCDFCRAPPQAPPEHPLQCKVACSDGVARSTTSPRKISKSPACQARRAALGRGRSAWCQGAGRGTASDSVRGLRGFGPPWEVTELPHRWRTERVHSPGGARGGCEPCAGGRGPKPVARALSIC